MCIYVCIRIYIYIYIYIYITENHGNVISWEKV